MLFGAGHVGRQMIRAKPSGVIVNASPTLDLSFTTGVMPGGVTFTRASTATYFDNTGTMQTAATNVPRLDYDPVALTARGLLIEEARTNLWLQSADASNAAWLKGQVTSGNPVPTGNQTTAPDGTLTAARVVYPAVSSAGNASELYQGITATAASYTLSMWLKGAVGGEQIYLGVTGPSYYSAPRITLTTQWQRFSLVTPALTAVSWFFYVGTDLRDGTAAATPAQTVYAWGAQVELGAFATSYIPTTAAAATRAAEVCSTPLGAWYVQQLGTLAVEALQPALCSKPIRLLGVEQAAAQTAINVAGSNNVAMYDSVGGLNTAVGLEPVGTVFKAAFAYANGAQSIVLNAGTPQTAAVAALGTGMTTLSIGCQIATISLQPNAWIRRARYWPRALSTAELQAVTT